MPVLVFTCYCQIVKKPIAKLKAKTYFEQVPLKVVKKVLHLDETANNGHAKNGLHSGSGKKKFPAWQAEGDR
jgi:hypothetical protein